MTGFRRRLKCARPYFQTFSSSFVDTSRRMSTASSEYQSALQHLSECNKAVLDLYVLVIILKTLTLVLLSLF